MSYDDVLELPLKVFTLYNTSINRLRAEDDTRTLVLLASANTADVIREKIESLREEMGTIVEYEHSDVSGFVAPEPGAFEKLAGLQNIR